MYKSLCKCVLHGGKHHGVETSGILYIPENLTTFMNFPGNESIFSAPAIHVSFALPNKLFQKFGQHMVQFAY